MSERRLGGRMIVGGSVLALLLLSGFFDQLLERRRNPNREVQSVAQGGVTRVLLQRNPQGHYVATGRINGRPAEFLLDTGATTVSVPGKLARDLQLERGPEILVGTAAGTVHAYRTTLREVRLGDITLYDVPGTINPHSDGEVLLGMTFLGRLELSQRDGVLELVQTP